LLVVPRIIFDETRLNFDNSWFCSLKLLSPEL
jgi:hypothetical protein